jgi:hypothetical protein
VRWICRTFARLCCASSTLSLALVGCAETSPHGDEQVGKARSTITVGESVDTSCSTSTVKGLSDQIIARANCIEPGAFSEVPAQPNVTFLDGVYNFLEEPARDAFVAAVTAHAETPLTVNSMLRTLPQQLLLFRWYQQEKCGISLAASPGSSNHETGLAMDVNQYNTWRPWFEAEGFAWLGGNDPVHFDYAGPDAVDHKGLDVIAFQLLWNENHPDDAIDADGVYGPQTEARLLASPAEGFARPVTCDPPAGETPDVYLAVDFRAPDAFADGASTGVADLFENEPATLAIQVENKGAAAGAVSLSIQLDEELFSVGGYAITYAPTAEGPFEPDPVAADPANPKGSSLPGDLSLTLGPMAAGEHKHIDVLLTARVYSVDKPAPVTARVWVSQVDDLYGQVSFDGEVTNVDDSQTFGGGRIQLAEPADVYSRNHWEWETDRLEGATVTGGATAKPIAGSLHVEGGGEPAVVSLPAIDLPAGAARSVELRAERAGGDGRAYLLVRRGDEPLAEGERFELELPASGTFAELDVDVGTGAIRGLGILPFEGESGVLDIDFVRIVAGAGGEDTEDEDDGCTCESSGRSAGSNGALALAALAVACWRRRGRRAT